MKKLLSAIVVLVLGTTSLMAQRTYFDKGGVASKLNQQIDLKRNSFNIDLGIGNAVDVGFHIQHNFNKYITWNIISARYAYQFTEKSSQFKATTGIRFNTPSFGRSNQMKVYLLVGVGYGGYEKVYHYSDWYYYYGMYDWKEYNWESSVLPEVELGIYLSNHFYLGATASFLPNDMEYSNCMARIGYEF